METKTCEWCGRTFPKPYKYSRRQWAKARGCSPRCGMAIRFGADTEDARFWRKVDRSGGPDACWPWLAFRDTHGYGRFNRDDRRPYLAHRLAYGFLVGPIPPGLTLDHLCRLPACVNPAHLEPVTQAENFARVPREVFYVANGKRRKTHCAHGHALTPENIYFHQRPNGIVARHCRECGRARVRRRRSQGSSTSAPVA